MSRFWEETLSVGQNYVMATFVIKTHMPFVYKLLQRHSGSGDHLKRFKRYLKEDRMNLNTTETPKLTNHPKLSVRA